MNHFEKNTFAKQLIQNEYDVEEPLEVLEQVADITIDYYFGNAKEYQVIIQDGDWERKLFNKDEVRHMKDVKDLYVGGQIIAILSFMILIACLFYLVRHFRRIRKTILIYTGVFYGILLLLVVAFVIWGYVSYQSDPYKDSNPFFIYLFINFHYLLFPFQPDKVALATGQNGYDIYTLTRILDTQLFMDAGIIIGIVVVITIFIWITGLIVFYKLHPKIVKKVDEIHERARCFEGTRC